jgi:hypothetical protein
MSLNPSFRTPTSLRHCQATFQGQSDSTRILGPSRRVLVAKLCNTSDPSLPQTTNTKGESSLLALLSCLARTVAVGFYGTAPAVARLDRSINNNDDRERITYSCFISTIKHSKHTEWLETGGLNLRTPVLQLHPRGFPITSVPVDQLRSGPAG